jgi:hypothetical protein
MLNQACNNEDSGGPSEAQRRIDEIVAEARKQPRPLFRPLPPPPPPLDPSSCLIEQRLAEELEYVRRLVEIMGDQLANDAAVLHRHAETMQGFDRVSQILGHCAKIIATADKGAAAERIGMQEMRSRLLRRPL